MEAEEMNLNEPQMGLKNCEDFLPKEKTSADNSPMDFFQNEIVAIH